MVDALRPALGVVWMLALAGCGQSVRTAEEANPAPTTGGASATGGSGFAGGGSAAGGTNAGSGGSAGGGVGGASGGAAGAALDPELTRRYTWEECGRIPRQGDPTYIFSLDIDASGSLLVSNGGPAATAWRVREPFESSEALWSEGGEGASNTDVSDNGRMVVISGDVRVAFDALSGALLPMDQPSPPVDDDLCLLTEYRFSPDGRFIAGKHYTTRVEVFETAGFTRVAELETGGCGQGLAFFDDAIVTPEGSFSTSTWQATSALNPQAGTQSDFSVHLDPDHAQPTTCSVGDDCRTVLGNGTTLTGGRHPRFSSDGHWIVAAGTLLHLPSGDTRAFDANATEALFAPNGDVIAGETDGSLVRFCRSVR